MNSTSTHHSIRPKAASSALAILVVTLFGLIGLAAAPAHASDVTNAPIPYPQNLQAEPTSTTEISVNWKSTTGAETSPNGFLVTARRTYPNPEEAIGTHKCRDLYRPSNERPTNATMYASECVIDGLDVGAYYEVQVFETFYYKRNSAAATIYSGTYVNGPSNITTDYTWDADGTDVVVRWDLPGDRTSLYSHGATLYNDQNRAVSSCYRNISQTGRCTFDDLIDGDYRAESFVNANRGYSPKPVSISFTIERPLPPRPQPEPEYNWWSTTNGQMYVNVSWNHGPNSSSSRYTVSVAGESCSASAVETPERLSCDVITDTDNMSFPVEANLTGGNVAEVLSLAAPPVRPSNPTNAGADEITETSARISWDHNASSNATIYAVWMNTHSGSCTISPPFTDRSSCRLDGLEPGTTYTANVYADSEIGRRSRRTARVTFTTDAPPPPPPPPVIVDEGGTDDPVDPPEKPPVDPPEVPPTVDPCDVGEKHHKKRARAINKANKQYQRALDKAVEKLEDRPKKLAKKIKRLQKKRDNKINKAKAAYNAICRT